MDMEEKAFAESVGNIIEKYRISSGLSRKDLTDKLGVHQTYLYAIEKKGVKLPLYHFFKLLSLFPAESAYSILAESLDIVGVPICKESEYETAQEKLDRIAAILNE